MKVTKGKVYVNWLQKRLFVIYNLTLSWNQFFNFNAAAGWNYNVNNEEGGLLLFC